MKLNRTLLKNVLQNIVQGVLKEENPAQKENFSSEKEDLSCTEPKERDTQEVNVYREDGTNQQTYAAQTRRLELQIEELHLSTKKHRISSEVEMDFLDQLEKICTSPKDDEQRQPMAEQEELSDSVYHGAEEITRIAEDVARQTARMAGENEVEAENDAAEAKSEELPVEEDEYEYTAPPLSLIKKSSEKRIENTEIDDLQILIWELFSAYEIEVDPKDVVETPRMIVCKYRLKLGTRLSSIKSMTSEIEHRTGRYPIKVKPIVDEPSVIGIYVPRETVIPIPLGDVLEQCINAKGLLLPIGTDQNGKPVIEDLEEVQHLLIGGTTGSGKSMLLHTLLLSLLYQCTPADLRMILIDTNVLELQSYSGIPHLLLPVSTRASHIKSILDWLSAECDRRIQKFRALCVRNFEEYRSCTLQEETHNTPRIVLVIDGMDSISKDDRSEVEEDLYQILRKGARTGIHLIISSQFYDKKVLSDRVQGYFTNRIALTTATAEQSRMVLEKRGAETLLGTGDLLYKRKMEIEPIRAQGYCVTTEEIDDVCNFLRYGSPSQYSMEIIDKITDIYETPEWMEPEEPDELFPAAVEIVLETGQASVSVLQRRLKLGYSRAALLVDQMEERGIVGPFEGSKPRQLLITRAQWNEQQFISE